MLRDHKYSGVMLEVKYAPEKYWVLTVPGACLVFAPGAVSINFKYGPGVGLY